MHHDDDVGIAAQRLTIAGFLVPSIPQIHFMNKCSEAKFAGFGYGFVRAAVIHENDFIHDLQRHLAIGPFQGFCGVIRRHYGYNPFTVQQNVTPSSYSCKFYHRSPGLNTTIAKEQDTSSPLPERKLFGSPKKKRQLLVFLLFVLTLLVYNPVIRFQFVNYDDPQYVTMNLHVQQGLHWHTVGWALTSFEFYNWHPLTWITYLMDYQLFELNPAGYHLMNVLYHALGAVLLFLVLHQGTGHLGRSFCVAILFALHPLNI